MQENGTEEITNEEILCEPSDNLLEKLSTRKTGLTTEEVNKKIEIYGYNELAKKKRRTVFIELLSYFKNPLIIILLLAAGVSASFGEPINAVIIFFMVIISVVLDFFQENKAEKAAEKLKKRVATTTAVLRDGNKRELRISDVVPGDIVMLGAGDIVPADCRLIVSKDLFIDQSSLTGESFPAEKSFELVRKEDVDTTTKWHNYIFMGTSVVSGTATAVVVKTGSNTEYGEIVKRSIERRPETEFERSLRKFGYLVMKITFLLVIFVFFVNALFKRNVLDSLMFAVALAVGLTPELLPMIVSINLSKGAIAMSKKGVIVKRLAAIQNFGSMDVLCSDKTGTLTENKVTLILHVDIDGRDDEKVYTYSFLNSNYQTGLRSALDDAILRHTIVEDKKLRGESWEHMVEEDILENIVKDIDLKNYKKVDEIPFDFIRRRVSVVVEEKGKTFILTKGAPEETLRVSSYYEDKGKVYELTKMEQLKIETKYKELSAEGYRVLGLTYKKVEDSKPSYTINDENGMVFLGFVAFMDPPKEGARESLQLLNKLGIDFKILTGDNELVTKKICEELGFEVKGVVLGSEITNMHDDNLARVVERANIFARVTPVQKNRIIDILKKNKHVVGYMGDGINDAPSMRAADVSISVENAVDIAKESADIILLHKDLKVLEEGVCEGRKTFGNTMKYILMGVSSNFGNMLSAAGASLFLPFLPMLPIQILLNNFLYDVSQLAIPMDNVDPEYIETPKKMDVKFIKDFMMFFGPLSSIFDFLTFFIMLVVFKAPEALFQTAWFVESLFTQTLIIFVIRTRKYPFFRSRPSKLLVYNMFGILTCALILPFTPIAPYFKFVPLPMSFLGVLILFVITYLALVETLKRWFYQRHADVLHKIS